MTADDAAATIERGGIRIDERLLAYARAEAGLTGKTIQSIIEGELWKVLPKRCERALAKASAELGNPVG